MTTASKDCIIHILDTKTAIEIVSLSGHSNWITSIAFSPDEDILYVSQSDANNAIIKAIDENALYKGIFTYTN